MELCSFIRRADTPELQAALTLINACYADDVELVEKLLKSNIDPNLADPCLFQSPTGTYYRGLGDLLIKRNQVACLNLLLDHGLSPNTMYAAYHVDEFLIELAISLDRRDCFKALLEYGAAPDVGTYDSDSSIRLALSKPDTFWGRELVKHGAYPMPFMKKALATKDTDLIRFLLAHGGKIPWRYRLLGIYNPKFLVAALTLITAGIFALYYIN